MISYLKSIKHNYFRRKIIDKLNGRVFSVYPLNRKLQMRLYRTNEFLNAEEALTAIQEGKVVVVKNLLQELSVVERIEGVINCSLDEVVNLHKSKSAKQLKDLIVNKRGSEEILEVQNYIIRNFAHSLGLSHVCVELEPNLRLQPPYNEVAASEKDIEREIGSGQMTPHSVHKDSWYFHPKNTFNIWVALSKATSWSGLSVLEDSQDRYPVTNGQQLNNFADALAEKHLELDLEPGDGVIFLAELIHGSIINQTEEMRATLSMRFSLEKPNNHIDKNYWYQGMDLTTGELKDIKSIKLSSIEFEPKKLEKIYEDSKIDQNVVDWDDETITVNDQDSLLVFPRYCPHKGVDLISGYYDVKNKKLVCPSHRLKVCQTKKVGNK